VNNTKHNFKHSLNNYAHMTTNYMHERELSKTQKLQAAAIAVVCGLIVYAVGVLTFLQSPVFSMFWIVSSQTALSAIYVTAGIAVALSMVLVISFMKKLKAMFPEMQNVPVVGNFKASIGAPVRAILPVDSQKTVNNLESSKREQKTRAYTLLIVSNESTGGPVADKLVIEDLKNKILEVKQGLLGKSFYTVEHVHPLSDEEVHIIMNS